MPVSVAQQSQEVFPEALVTQRRVTEKIHRLHVIDGGIASLSREQDRIFRSLSEEAKKHWNPAVAIQDDKGYPDVFLAQYCLSKAAERPAAPARMRPMQHQR